MGGWCRSREKCGAYGATDRERIVERACPPGQDLPEPIRPAVGPRDPRWWQSVRVEKVAA